MHEISISATAPFRNPPEELTALRRPPSCNFGEREGMGIDRRENDSEGKERRGKMERKRRRREKGTDGRGCYRSSPRIPLVVTL